MVNHSEHFIKTVHFEFQRLKLLAEKALQQLDDEELRKQYDPESNSIQILIQHLSGNMISRWTDFLTTDGEKEWRKRDEEFELQQWPREAVMRNWESGWQLLFDSLELIKPENLHQNVFIRKEALTVTQALLRQLSHYAYHVGQIVQLAKVLKGENWQTLSIAKNKFGEHRKGKL